MRNPNSARIPVRPGPVWIVLVACGAAIVLSGCDAEQKAKSDLRAGYASLESHDYNAAIARADAYLQRTPSGAGSAEALYLRGRALEQRSASSRQEVLSNLQGARAAYIEALGQRPSPRLESYLHTSLANVAYFQDDFETAINEWTIAYDKLEDENVKSWVLYRIGLCRQRSGQFADADAVFKAVQERYPNTVPAQRAKEKQGARGFSVQLATFANSASADSAIGALRQEGVMATKQPDAKGRSVVLVGPLPSYQQATAIKQRYASKYPDALVVP